MGGGVKVVFQFGGFFGAERHRGAPGLPRGFLLGRPETRRARQSRAAKFGTLVDVSGGMTHSRSAGSVLVVEDDTNLREGLCDILVEEGYMVDGAKDGADALEHLHDFALPDVWMPGMDGYEFLERRQQDELLKEVPVIVISATPDPARLHFPLVATMDKPVNLTALLRVLEKEILEKHSV